MKTSLLLILSISTFALTSCGLVRSAAQVPGRTVQGLGRTLGFRLTATEYTTDESKGEERQTTAPAAK